MGSAIQNLDQTHIEYLNQIITELRDEQRKSSIGLSKLLEIAYLRDSEPQDRVLEELEEAILSLLASR